MNDTKDIPTVPIAHRFTNPFQGLKGDPSAATVNCLMPKEAFVRVKQCRLEGGTIQTTMNLLWIKLINLLEKKGIMSYADVREFEDAVQRSVLVLPEDLGSNATERRPITESNTAASVRDEPRATEHLRGPTAGEPSEPIVPSDVDKVGPKGSRRRTKSQKGGRTPG